LQDHESFEVPLNGKQESIFHQHTLLSSATHDFDASSLKADTSSNSPQKRKEGSWADVLNDWWWWELGSVLLSCACFIAIVITLLPDLPLVTTVFGWVALRWKRIQISMDPTELSWSTR
jgi:hypothetical protein